MFTFRILNVLFDLATYYCRNELDVYHGGNYEHKPCDIDSRLEIALQNLAKDQVYIDTEGSPSDCKDDYGVSFISPNAISLNDEVQVVTRFSGSPEEIHVNFDFVHATNYFTFKDGLVTNKDALMSLLTKTLVYRGSKYPITSIIRSKKFIKRGFNINAGEYLKMVYQCSKLNLEDIRVLENQLIGVDVAYFGTLIKALKKFEKSKGSLDLYLFEMIDKIFG